MAGELQVALQVAGLTVYAHIWSATGTIWNGSSFETYLTANIANYDIALTQQGTASRFYIGNFPAAAAGVYQITYQQQVGAAPAEDDIFVGSGSYEWSGTVVIPLSSLTPLDAAALRAAVGLASANLDTQLAGILADTDNIQTRIPAALVSGRMDSSVGAMAADTLTASALAADAVAEIQSGLSTAAALATVQADTDNIQTRLPAALVGGRIDASVGAMASGVLTAAAIDGSAISSGKFAAGAINAAAIATDAISGAKIAADAVTKIQAGLSTLTQAQVLSDATPFAGASVAAIKAKTDNLPTDPADQSAVAALIAAIPAGVWAEVLETGFSASRELRIAAAAVAGKSLGSTFRNLADTLDQITGTSTPQGDRTAAAYGA